LRRVLIAASQDWVGIARLPSLVARSGMESDLLGPPGTRAWASSRIRQRFAEPGGASAVAAKLLAMADGYDRVIAADEPLLTALAEIGDPAVERLLPAGRDALGAIVDKTRFPTACDAAGVPVPRWRVAAGADEVHAAASELGPRVAVKGRLGHGGAAVRLVDSAAAAVAAADELGGPVLVQEFVDGRFCTVPCLFERGRLLAAFVAERLRTVGPLGPSAMNAVWSPSPRLLDALVAAGNAWGMHGFVSPDVMLRAGDGSPVVIEVNPRPVPQLHIGRAVGVDMEATLRAAVEGRAPERPLLPAREGATFVLFPQELQRLRLERGGRRGMLEWALRPRNWRDLPWDDSGLMTRYLGRRSR